MLLSMPFCMIPETKNFNREHGIWLQNWSIFNLLRAYFQNISMDFRNILWSIQITLIFDSNKNYE